jgi:hypothetical protein
VGSISFAFSLTYSSFGSFYTHISARCGPHRRRVREWGERKEQGEERGREGRDSEHPPLRRRVPRGGVCCVVGRFLSSFLARCEPGGEPGGESDGEPGGVTSFLTLGRLSCPVLER